MARHSRRRQLLDDLREHVTNAAPWGLTFAPCGTLTAEQREYLEAYLKYHFRQWADTWIYPWIDQVERGWLGPRDGAAGDPSR